MKRQRIAIRRAHLTDWHFVQEVAVLAYRPRGSRRPCSFDRCAANRSERAACEPTHCLETDGGRYCIRPDAVECAHRIRDWKPSPALHFPPSDDSGYLARRDVHSWVEDRIDAAAFRDDLIGSTARAWRTEEWHEVDALRPNSRRRPSLSAWRMTAQERLWRHIAAEAEEWRKHDRAQRPRRG